jgi:hypothetical protein
MNGRFTSASVRLIHEIVVDQGRSVENFQGRGNSNNPSSLLHQFGWITVLGKSGSPSPISKECPEAFAALEKLLCVVNYWQEIVGYFPQLRPLIIAEAVNFLLN